jgi:peptidoglycan/xylan/chitin deacetylase (PgdA/CDA1 family)
MSVEAREGGVMLMHDIHNFTAQNLKTLLTALESRGYRFVRIDDAQVFPNLNAPR